MTVRTPRTALETVLVSNLSWTEDSQLSLPVPASLLSEHFISHFKSHLREKLDLYLGNGMVELE